MTLLHLKPNTEYCVAIPKKHNNPFAWALREVYFVTIKTSTKSQGKDYLVCLNTITCDMTMIIFFIINVLKTYYI